MIYVLVTAYSQQYKLDEVRWGYKEQRKKSRTNNNKKQKDRQNVKKKGKEVRVIQLFENKKMKD